LAKVKAGMEKYGVVLTQHIVPDSYNIVPYTYTKVKNIKGGGKTEEIVNEFYCYGEIVFTWYCAENPEDKIECPYVFTGQQGDAAQAFGAAMTYANRYFLMKFFQIATPDDDPDAWRSKKQEAEVAEDIEIAKAIVEEIHAEVTDCLSAIKDDKQRAAKRESILAVVKKYEKSGNYMSIKKIDVAKKLYEDLQTEIGG